MRSIFLLFFTSLLLFSASIQQIKWKKGELFSEYLRRNGIPTTLLKEISAGDLQYLSEIQADERFYELRENGKLQQALIPVGEEMQIHLFKDVKGEKFHFDIIPIVCRKLTDAVMFTVEKGVYDDIDHCTKNPRLGYLLKKCYAKSINLKTLKKGDKVSFIYTQKSRLGRPCSSPEIKASLIYSRGRNRFVFVDKSNMYYDDVYKDVAYTVEKKVRTEAGKSFVKPLKKMKITSKFTHKRWHPILKRYRPHLGIDLRGKRGTPIYATHTGKVIYSGWMGGYGKVIKISHPGGFVSLYAHQSKLLVRKGEYVKRGQMIGYVGNTGRSTGPHLHFGLYHNGRAVDPVQYIERKALSKKRIEIQKIKKHKIIEIAEARENKKLLLKYIEGDNQGFEWNMYVKPYNLIGDRSRYEERDKKL